MDLELRVDSLEKKVKTLEQQLNLLLDKAPPQVNQSQATNTSTELKGSIVQQLHTNKNKQDEEMPPQTIYWKKARAKLNLNFCCSGRMLFYYLSLSRR
jgi:hypothetical protein